MIVAKGLLGVALFFYGAAAFTVLWGGAAISWLEEKVNRR